MKIEPPSLKPNDHLDFEEISFNYQPKLKPEAIGKSAPSFCSRICADFVTTLELPTQAEGMIRNSSNAFPAPPVEGSSTTELEYMEQEAEHYQVLQCAMVSGSEALPDTDQDKWKVTARDNIPAGTVLCSLNGAIVDVKKKKGEFPYVVLSEWNKKLELNLFSLAAHMRMAKPEEVFNARVVAQYSLTEADDSPLRKKKALVPGAYVLVAETPIASGEEIVFEALTADSNADYLAPAPICQLSAGRAKSDSRTASDAGAGNAKGAVKPDSVGARLGYFRSPGDSAFYTDDVEAFTPPHFFNEDKDIPRVVNGFFVENLSTKLKPLYEELVKQPPAELACLDGGIFPLSIFRDTIILPYPTGAVEGTRSAELIKQFRSNLNASVGSRKSSRKKSTPRCTINETGEYPEDELEKVSKALWDATLAGFDPGMLGKETIMESKPRLLNREYCEQWHCVLSNEESRANLSLQAQQIASYSCSQFFNTYQLIDGPRLASQDCKEAWRDGLLGILSSPVLITRLTEMKDARKEAGEKDFIPAVIVEGLAAIFYELEEDLNPGWSLAKTASAEAA